MNFTHAQIAMLDSIAERMYDNQLGWMAFYNTFDKDQLAALWKLCVLTKDLDGNLDGGRSYDDEVYDALYEHGYFTEEVTA